MKNLTESIKLHFCSESEHRYKKESVSSLASLQMFWKAVNTHFFSNIRGEHL